MRATRPNPLKTPRSPSAARLALSSVPVFGNSRLASASFTAVACTGCAWVAGTWGLAGCSGVAGVDDSTGCTGWLGSTGAGVWTFLKICLILPFWPSQSSHIRNLELFLAL